MVYSTDAMEVIFNANFLQKKCRLKVTKMSLEFPGWTEKVQALKAVLVIS